jgi:hypothetical protein
MNDNEELKKYCRYHHVDCCANCKYGHGYDLYGFQCMNHHLNFTPCYVEVYGICNWFEEKDS